MGSLLTLVFVVLAYKGGMNWLAYKERQAYALQAGVPAIRTEPTQAEWEVVEDPLRVTQVQVSRQQLPPPAATGQTPGLNKWLFMSLCMLYVVWPIDIVPDFIPVLGWGDDVVAIILAIQQFFKK
jgi:hypothetical protein